MNGIYRMFRKFLKINKKYIFRDVIIAGLLVFLISKTSFPENKPLTARITGNGSDASFLISSMTKDPNHMTATLKNARKIDESEPDKDQSPKKTLSVEEIESPITNSIGMKFEYIPPDTFMMGSLPDEPGRDKDERCYEVTLSQGFYMQTTEVTQGQWQAVMGKNPSNFFDCGDNCPVEGVSWYDVQQFIKELNKKENTAKYRLPTEAQWEYASRAGSVSWFCFGDDETKLKDYAWFQDNSQGKTHPVAQKKPNTWNLYDMHGNVWEWCKNWDGEYPSKATFDPTGPKKGSFRVVRGGSWYYPLLDARCANRFYMLPGQSNYNLGFRLVMTR